MYWYRSLIHTVIKFDSLQSLANNRTELLAQVNTAATFQICVYTPTARLVTVFAAMAANRSAGIPLSGSLKQLTKSGSKLTLNDG